VKGLLNTVIYGIYLGAAAIALALILYFTGVENAAPGDVSRTGMLPIIFIFIYLAIRKPKWKDLDGRISFWESFKTGITVAIAGGVIMALFTYLWYTFNSELLMRMAQNTIQRPKFKQLTQNQIRLILNSIMTYTPRIGALAIFEANLIISVIVTMVLSIFFQSKNKKEPKEIEIAH
jgi:hypothetical protein